MKSILISVNITKKNPDINGCDYILFWIDVYFTEYLLALDIDEKGHIDRDLIFEEKRQEALEKIVNLLRLIQLKKTTMQTMKLAEYKHL